MPSSSKRLSKTISYLNPPNIYGETEKEKTINRVARSYNSIIHFDVTPCSPKSIS